MNYTLPVDKRTTLVQTKTETDISAESITQLDIRAEWFDLFQDTDLDGAGNSTGIEITSNGFINVNMPIPATGNSLQVRVVMGQN